MRAALLAVALVTGLAGLEAAQVYREPLMSAWPVKVIAPSRGMPLQLGGGTITFSHLPQRATLAITASSLTIRPILISGITLRVAVGPMPDGILTFRMRPVTSAAGPQAVLPGPLARLTTSDGAVPLTFVIALEDHAPPATALRRTTQVVVTVERLEGDEGQLIFENPDASELLWEALGRPSFSQ